VKIYKVILQYNMATKVTITLTEEELSAVRALFAYNGWDWNPGQEEVVSDEMPSTSGVVGPAIEREIPLRPECPDCLCPQLQKEFIMF
jgi:hypothetical protein